MAWTAATLSLPSLKQRGLLTEERTHSQPTRETPAEYLRESQPKNEASPAITKPRLAAGHTRESRPTKQAAGLVMPAEMEPLWGTG